MTNTDDSRHNAAVAAKVLRHINHYGGAYEDWRVGIEEEGSDRDDSDNRHPMRFETKSAEEAKNTMSWLLGMGLMADDEYDTEPTILFVYTEG